MSISAVNTRIPSRSSGTPRSPIPGFRLALGYTLFWLGLIVLIPLAGVFFKAATLGPAEIWRIVSSERVIAALDLEPRPPHPQGFTMPENDLSLLDPVRARGRLWRDV